MDKLLIFAAFVLLIVLASSVRKDRKNKKIIFFGDSITEAGTAPKGYITMMQTMLRQYGINSYDLVGAGISGNKVYDLYQRMDRDVIARLPFIAVIFIGVNDVWHKKTHASGTDAATFERYYRTIVSELLANKIRVVVCTPAFIGEKTDFSNEQDADLDEYCDIIRRIAAEENLPLVDLRNALREYNLLNNPQNLYSGILTSDGVHLNNRGNQLVAEQMWAVIKDSTSHATP